MLILQLNVLLVYIFKVASECDFIFSILALLQSITRAETEMCPHTACQ